MMIPHELWQKIFTYLDLRSQHNVTKVSGDFCELIISIWKSNISRLIPKFDVITEDHDSVRLNVTMRSLLKDSKYNSDFTHLYELLHQHKHLEQIHDIEEIKDCNENFQKYSFFHDYNVSNCKYLDLHQKWPRPGQKTLEKFTKQNQDLVYLSVEDSRGNIEAVHYLTTEMRNLQALRLYATDPLLPYKNILLLKHLQFLEISLDSFYREHRDQFLFGLSQLINLQVLKIPCCYGMSEANALHIVETCSTLKIIHFPFNSYLSGWFLETFLDRRRRGEWPSNVVKLNMFINTAYVNLQTVIPELFSDTLINSFNDIGIKLDIKFVHQKLPLFNPHYLDIKRLYFH